MRYTHRCLLGWLVAMALVVAAPVTASAQGFVDDFETYPAGGPLLAPWADWGTGTAPVGGSTIMADGTAYSGAQYVQLGAWSEPVQWFGNPLDVKDRVVELNWYTRATGGWVDMFAGSMGAPQAAPTKQYGTNVGQVHIDFAAGTVTYAGDVNAGNMIAGWNEIKVVVIARSPNAMMGQGELFVNGVSTGFINTWALDPNDGFNGVDWYGADVHDVDHMSVLQTGMAAPLAWQSGAPKSWYPGTKGLRGGIGWDGGRYIYALGGSNSGELYRYDIFSQTWTQLASKGITPDFKESHGVAITANGKICVSAGHGFPNDQYMYEYDIATNTWSPAPVKGSADEGPQIEAVGNMVFAGQVPSQVGTTQYDAATSTFITGQASPNNPPTGWPWGADLAYGGGNYLYLLAKDPNNNNATLGRWDVTQPAATGVWDPLDTLSDLAVAFPAAGQSALTYVPEDGTLFALHQEWGVAGLYEVAVTGDRLYATLDGSSDLYEYNVATDTWTIHVGALPFVFGEGDDIAGAFIPEPATMVLAGLGLLALLIRRRRK